MATVDTVTTKFFCDEKLKEHSLLVQEKEKTEGIQSSSAQLVFVIKSNKTTHSLH